MHLRLPSLVFLKMDRACQVKLVRDLKFLGIGLFTLKEIFELDE